MSGKRLLYFYPQNLVRVRTGAHRRAAELLEYFRSRSFEVDLLTLDGFVTRWEPADLAALSWLQAVNVVPMRYGPADVLRNGWRVLRHRLPDLAVGGLRRRAREMAAGRHYDAVVISYVLWARLAEYFPRAIRVIDLHDFITLNSHQRSGGGRFRLGRMFQDEIAAIGAFHTALSISCDETAALSGSCPGTRFVDVPVSFPEQLLSVDATTNDLLYVGGADNPFNRKGLEWLLEQVRPQLPASTTIAVAGDVCKHVPELPNLRKLGRIENLDDAYRAAQVVVCPMFSGTGLKVKVVEALSHGRPVVTTAQGLTGFPEKERNGCLVAADGKSFAEAVERLLGNRDFYGAVRDEGIAYFRRTFCREVVWQRLDSVFLETL